MVSIALALRLEATPCVALPVQRQVEHRSAVPVHDQAMDSLQRPYFAMQHILCPRKGQHGPAMQRLRFTRPGCGRPSLRQSGHSRGSHCQCLASNVTALLCRCDALYRIAKPCLCLGLRWDASHCPCGVLPCIGLPSVRCPCIVLSSFAGASQLQRFARPVLHRALSLNALPCRHIGVAASRAARVSRSGRPPRSMISVSTPVRLR